MEIISEEEKNSLKAKLQNRLNPHSTEEKNKIFTIFLFTIVICLSLVISYVFLFKDTKNSEVKIPQKNSKTISIAPDNPNVDINFLKSMVAKLSVQNKQLSDQVWLLGLQANQNAVILKTIDPSNAHRVSELSEDWKLNQIPDRVKMKPEYISKLREFLSSAPKTTSLEATEADMPFPIEE